MTTAEIITIGTELLLGETADTNTRFIARALRALGVDLFRAQTVGDNTARIAEAVREAAARADIVITTGGLGPTVDDPTRQAIAEACEAPLEFHPELWEQITARIARYGRLPTENQKRQAYIPRGAIVIENPVGTAPAFIVDFPPLPSLGEGRGVRAVIISLPGVPREMETLLAGAVVPFLQERFGLHELILVRTLHASGLGEGMVDDKIGDLETLANPTVGLTAHSGIVDIRIAAKAASEAEAQTMIAAVEADVRARLGEAIYGADEETLEGAALDMLARRGWTLACLESGMGSALLARLGRGGHAAWRGGSSRTVRAETLAEETEAVRRSEKASAALGVRLEQMDESQTISVVLLTPSGKAERTLTYGGHPGNAPRWAANMALDFLRRAGQEAG